MSSPMREKIKTKQRNSAHYDGYSFQKLQLVSLKASFRTVALKLFRAVISITDFHAVELTFHFLTPRRLSLPHANICAETHFL